MTEGMQGNVEVNMLVITLLFKKVDSQFECFLKGERERERDSKDMNLSL